MDIMMREWKKAEHVRMKKNLLQSETESDGSDLVYVLSVT